MIRAWFPAYHYTGPIRWALVPRALALWVLAPLQRLAGWLAASAARIGCAGDIRCPSCGYPARAGHGAACTWLELKRREDAGTLGQPGTSRVHDGARCRDCRAEASP